ncbi:hypothetical protein VaNZ11_007063 [Volvox africanus]|uniref:FAD-binding domain-containing protein n=1 Tax=Volvox africanus TaxID=51714 RepID=A0ABQ5S395_9CHLO|nr:hypothetical protein VaNZ11_007063 [Volvox africanus]
MITKFPQRPIRSHIYAKNCCPNRAQHSIYYNRWPVRDSREIICRNQMLTMPKKAIVDVDVAVVGGGPAGLAAAAALQRVVGSSMAIRVFEARTPSGERGATVQVDVNGLRAIEAIDPCTVHRLYEQGILRAGMSIHDDVTGERMPQREIHHDMMSDLEKHGHSGVMAQWWALTEILEGALPPGVVHHGLKLLECVALHPQSEESDRAELLDSGSECGENRDSGFRYRLTLQRCGTDEGTQESKGAGSQKSERQEQVIASEVTGDIGEMQALVETAFTAAASAGNGVGDEMAAEGIEASDRVLVRAKWLVGADGYYSRVRRQVGDGSAPTPLGDVVWWGTVNQQDLDVAGTTWPQPLLNLGINAAWSACYCPKGQFGPTALRLGLIMRASFGDPAAQALTVEGKASQADGNGALAGGFWYFRARLEDVERALQESPADVREGDASAALQRVLATFRDLPPDVISFLAATPPRRVTERRLCQQELDRLVPGAWTDGQGMVLLGDAAHAWRPDGQGTNLALEDAAVLGEVVRRFGLGSQAFSAFEEARMPRIKEVCNTSYLHRAKLINKAFFTPLWSGRDLPADLHDVHDGLQWSRERIHSIVEARLNNARLAVNPNGR